MFALTQYVREKKTNIVQVHNLLGSKKEKDTTSVKWGKSEYEATIKRISSKYTYINILNMY